MFDKLKMLKQAKDLQSKMASMNFDHEENGIKLSVNGKQEVISLEITNDELLEDKEKLERLLKQTVNYVSITISTKKILFIKKSLNRVMKVKIKNRRKRKLG